MNRFTGAVRRGVTGIQSAYNRQKKAAENRAKRELESARTSLAKEKIKSGLEIEKLKLRRELYETKAAIQREKQAVAEAKERSGKPNLRGRVGRVTGFLSKTGTSFRELQGTLYGPPPRKAKRKLSTKKKAVLRKRRLAS